MKSFFCSLTGKHDCLQFIQLLLSLKRLSSFQEFFGGGFFFLIDEKLVHTGR